ncbi:class I SAM-dependent methyltransferase [Streptomyces monticola]|uniref:Class I SAM-dependent methyltransferase n=1 Tax=Streptomyces monticola TaxID=2666263 RepID=A0ABW2JTA2_9ACTN
MQEQTAWGRRLASATTEQAVVYRDVLVPAVFGPCATQLVSTAVQGDELRVLDAGSGTGAVARAAAMRLRPGAHVTAVDLNGAFLGAARGLQARAGASNAEVTYQQGDVLELPFADGTFDLLLTQHVLQYLPELPRAVEELARVTNADGRLWAVVWQGLAANPMFRALTELVRRQWNEELAERFSAPWSLAPERLRQVMEGAGLVDVESVGLDVMAHFRSVEEVLWVVAFSPVGAALRQLEPSEAAAFTARMRQAVTPWHEGTGVRAPMAAGCVGGRRAPAL